MKMNLTVLLLATILMIPTQAADEKKAASALDEAKMMEMWMKLNAKGKPHADFQKSVGTWTAVEKHYMGGESFDGKGTTTLRTILDGRYLVQEYQSESQMGKFEGFGITAYDNLQQQYVMAWMDNMSTGIFISHGKKDGNTTTYTGKQKMPDGTVMFSQAVIKEVGPKKMTLTMSGRTADEEEFRKNMEIVYTRVE